MTEIQNPKQLAFDPPAADLDIVIWNLFVIWLLVICYFRFIRVRHLQFLIWHLELCHLSSDWLKATACPFLRRSLPSTTTNIPSASP